MFHTYWVVFVLSWKSKILRLAVSLTQFQGSSHRTVNSFSKTCKTDAMITLNAFVHGVTLVFV